MQRRIGWRELHSRDYFNNFNTTRYPNPCKSVFKFYEVTRSAPKKVRLRSSGLFSSHAIMDGMQPPMKSCCDTTCHCFDGWRHHISFSNRFIYVHVTADQVRLLLLLPSNTIHPAAPRRWPKLMTGANDQKVSYMVMFPCHLVRWSNSEQKHSRDCLPLWFR